MTPQEQAEAIRQMQLTPGWSLVEKFLAKKIDKSKSRLMVCATMDEVISCRATVRAYELFSVHMQEIIEGNTETEE